MNEEINKRPTSTKIRFKLNLIIVVVVMMLMFGILYAVYRTTNINEPLVTEQEKSNLISLSEISKHNNKESCWTTINGGVYDVTKFISQHKGGDRILEACGIDATDLFTGKSSMGRIHSQMAIKLLSSMKIGTLN